MKILIVEDDPIKLEALETFLGEPHSGLEISKKLSYNSGLDAILSNEYDLLILDMALQTYEPNNSERAGISKIYGGKEIVMQMRLNGVSTPTLVITQFDTFGEEGNIKTLKELDEELQMIAPSNYMGSIYFNIQSTSWHEELSKILNSKGWL